MRAEKWVRLLVEVLGRAPQTPEEALATLGALLRANPAEKEEFVKEAHEVWVKGTSWEVRGTLPRWRRWSSPPWKRPPGGWRKSSGGGKGVTNRKSGSSRGVTSGSPGLTILVTPKRPDKEGVFWIDGYAQPEGHLEGRLRGGGEGKEITSGGVLPGSSPRRAAHMVATRAAKIAARKEEGDFLTMPWGERVRLLFGDRWEDLERLEPRVLEAIRGLREILEEGEELDSLDSSEKSEDSWVHQTRVPVWAIRALLEAQGEDLRGWRALTSMTFRRKSSPLSTRRWTSTLRVRGGKKLSPPPLGFPGSTPGSTGCPGLARPLMRKSSIGGGSSGRRGRKGWFTTGGNCSPSSTR